MARWKGDADKDTETMGRSGGSFTPAPRGIYTIQVANYRDGMTAGGNGRPQRPMVTLECEIAEGQYLGKKLWINITNIPKGEKGHGILIHICHAFGLEIDGPYDFDTEVFQGRQARALLGIKPYEKVVNGIKYTNQANWVEEFYSPGHPEPEDGKLPPPHASSEPGHPALAKAAGQPAHDTRSATTKNDDYESVADTEINF